MVPFSGNRTFGIGMNAVLARWFWVFTPLVVRFARLTTWDNDSAAMTHAVSKVRLNKWSVLGHVCQVLQRWRHAILVLVSFDDRCPFAREHRDFELYFGLCLSIDQPRHFTFWCESSWASRRRMHIDARITCTDT